MEHGIYISDTTAWKLITSIDIYTAHKDSFGWKCCEYKNLFLVNSEKGGTAQNNMFALFWLYVLGCINSVCRVLVVQLNILFGDSSWVLIETYDYQGSLVVAVKVVLECDKPPPKQTAMQKECRKFGKSTESLTCPHWWKTISRKKSGLPSKGPFMRKACQCQNR